MLTNPFFLAWLEHLETASLNMMARTAHRNGGHMYRTTGRQSRSLRIRSTNRKAARRAKARAKRGRV